MVTPIKITFDRPPIAPNWLVDNLFFVIIVVAVNIVYDDFFGFFSESITAAIGTLFDRDRITQGGGVTAFFFDRMMFVSMCWLESEQIEYVLASGEIKCVR